jgi:hypothetical protein
MDETELSKQIAAYLNKVTLGMHFEFIDSFCDVADLKNKIYIEVKPDHFAPAQILHAIAEEGIKDAKYVGVADGKKVKLYVPPAFGKIRSLARKIDPTLVFSPFGLFCGVKRYVKLFDALMKDFAFVKGHVFGGENFHDINAKKPIALTVFKYAPNACTKHLDLSFEFLNKSGETKSLHFKEMVLLKDGWRYRDGSKYVRVKTEDAISAPRNERFSDPRPKIIAVSLQEGSGAEISPDNLRLDKVVLNVPNMPPELVYALWSVSVGMRTFSMSSSDSLHPIYFDNAYVHLPDFTKKKTLEIMAYATLEVLLKNYAEDRIGFFGTNKVFRFGNERLTEGVEYLLKQCKDAPTYNGNTIGDAFELIRDSKIDITELRKSLKEEVSKRLSAIGYWDFIPIPKLDSDAGNGDREDSTESDASETESSLAPFERRRNRKGRGVQNKLNQ